MNHLLLDATCGCLKKMSCAVQLVSSSTGNLPINSNDLNTLIQGVRATQVIHPSWLAQLY